MRHDGPGGPGGRPAQHGRIGGGTLSEWMYLDTYYTNAANTARMTQIQTQMLQLQINQAEAARRNTAVRVRIDANGVETFYNAQGQVLGCPNNILQFKQTQAYLSAKSQYEAYRAQKVQREVQSKLEEDQAKTDQLINVHWRSPNVRTNEDSIAELEMHKPEHYFPMKFREPEPTEADVRLRLEAEAKYTLTKSLFFKRKCRKWVDEQLPIRFNEKKTAWASEKAKFERDEQERKQRLQQAQREYDLEREMRFGPLSTGDKDAVYAAFDEWVAVCKLPLEIDIDYEWDQDDDRFIIDLDLPEIEDLPRTMLAKDASGENVKRKKKSQTELYREYATLVFSLAIYVTASLMNLSPAIHDVLISGYTQRRDEIGDIQNVYVYSILFTRDMFEGKNITGVEPISFCESAPKNRMRIMINNSLKPIVPYEKLEESPVKRLPA